MNEHQPLHVWLAKALDGQTLAFADVSLSEYVAQATLLPIPAAPRCCAQVMEWQQALVPVFRLGCDTAASAGVLLLHTDTEAPLIGLATAEAPRPLTIGDADLSGFEEERCGIWRQALLSGFVHDGRSVPLIDPDLMCEAPFMEGADRALFYQRGHETVI